MEEKERLFFVLWTDMGSYQSGGFVRDHEDGLDPYYYPGSIHRFNTLCEVSTKIQRLYESALKMKTVMKKMKIRVYVTEENEDFLHLIFQIAFMMRGKNAADGIAHMHKFFGIEPKEDS